MAANRHPFETILVFTPEIQYLVDLELPNLFQQPQFLQVSPLMTWRLSQSIFLYLSEPDNYKPQHDYDMIYISKHAFFTRPLDSFYQNNIQISSIYLPKVV